MVPFNNLLRPCQLMGSHHKLTTTNLPLLATFYNYKIIFLLVRENY